MNKVILFGGNHHNGLGIIRSLGRKGIYPDVLIHTDLPEEKCHILKSKYINSYKYVRTCEDGIDYLKEQRKETSSKPVIICYSDGGASAIDMHYDELKDYYCLPGCGINSYLTGLMNKETMAQMAVKAGLDVPDTILVEEGIVPSTVPLPCITKPLSSIEGDKADIKICRNREELKNVVRGSKCKRFQVQRFIEKDFEYQLIGLSTGGGRMSLFQAVLAS